MGAWLAAVDRGAFARLNIPDILTVVEGSWGRWDGFQADVLERTDNVLDLRVVDGGCGGGSVGVFKLQAEETRIAGGRRQAFTNDTLIYFIVTFSKF